MNLLLEQFIRYLADERGLSRNTLDGYRRDLLSFDRFLRENGRLPLERASRIEIHDYLRDLKEKGRSVSTISRNIASIRAFYQYLLRQQIIERDPSHGLESPKQEKKTPTILTVEEIEALFQGPDLQTPIGLRDKAMLELLYATGIRVSELVSLDLQDVQLSLGYIHCKGESAKERVIPLGAPAIQSLKMYLEKGRPLLLKKDHPTDSFFLNHLGRRLSRQGFWKLIKKYALQASIEKEITPQTFRHSFAAHMIENGADLKAVQEMLGYADISTTQIYANYSKKRLKDVYFKAHPRA
ncbi:site-specific tyrosine recombinase XerD [Bacillaceae bacterium]